MTRETSDPTRLVPATAAAGLVQDLSGLAGAGSEDARAWFDERLHGFMAALTHDQTGRARSAVERRALATAAGDMVARIGWTDTAGAQDGASFRPEQLLANTYQVRHLIARGGIGEVYRARHRDLRTEHAIKVLLPQHTLDMTLVRMLLNEARVLLSVRVEGVVACQGLLRDSDGRLLLVMEHLRGRTLSDRLADGPLSEPEFAALASRLASTLDALHGQNIVHNDLAPDNILLRDDSCQTATLIDFGLARSLADPADTQVLLDFAGKYSWVSPEQLSGPDALIDHRSDLYSLGLVLAACARGERLDMGHDLGSARAARAEVPSLTGIPEALAPSLAALLQPNAADRPMRATGFGAEPPTPSTRVGITGWLARLRPA